MFEYTCKELAPWVLVNWTDFCSVFVYRFVFLGTFPFTNKSIDPRQSSLSRLDTEISFNYSHYPDTLPQLPEAPFNTFQILTQCLSLF